METTIKTTEKVIESVKRMKTSELLDLLNLKIEDNLYDLIMERLNTMFPFDYIDRKDTENEETVNKISERLDELEKRLDKIDDLYMIANKLEKILNVLHKK